MTRENNQEKNIKNQQQNQQNHQQQQTNDNDCQKYIDQIEQLQKELQDYKDKYVRLLAEFDNFRKRSTKEKADLIKTASENVLKDLLPVIDDFERALEHIDQTDDINALKEGIQLIYNRFQTFLKQHGVEEIEAEGLELDPNLHEAIQQVPAESEEQKGKIVKVVQKGYKLNDKIIRHAKVIVAM